MFTDVTASARTGSGHCWSSWDGSPRQGVICGVIQGRGTKPRLLSFAALCFPQPGALPDPKPSQDLQQENAAASPEVTHRVKHPSPAAACRGKDVPAPAQPLEAAVSQDTAPGTPARTWQMPLAKTKPPWWVTPPSRPGEALLLGTPSCKSLNLSHWHSSHWSLQPPLGTALGAGMSQGPLNCHLLIHLSTNTVCPYFSMPCHHLPAMCISSSQPSFQPLLHRQD